MRSYLILFGISLFFSLLLTPFVRRFATAIGAVDVPDNERRIHKHITPRMGGLGIYIAFLLTLCVVPFLQNAVGQSFLQNLSFYLGIIGAATLVFGLGVFDDLWGAPPLAKVLVQIIAAIPLHALGFGIQALNLPFAGEYTFPFWLSFPLTALWVVGITNAFNLIDGIDGLAAGASVFALGSILFFSAIGINPAVSTTAIILIGAVIGFLYFNFHPATIFLGDSGSLFLGFMVAALSLAGAQKSTTTVAIAIPLISFGLPVLDVGLTLFRRFIRGNDLFQSDRGHIHHRLLDHGLSQRQTVILLYAVCGLFSLFGIMLINPSRSQPALIFCMVGVIVVLGVQKLRYPEFEELGSSIRRRVAKHRKNLSVNVGMRHRGGDLKKAESLAELLAVLSNLATATEFEGVKLKLAIFPRLEQASEILDAVAVNGWRLPIGQTTIIVEQPLTLMFETNGQFVEDMTPESNYWELTIPLFHQDKALGTLSFLRQISEAEHIAVDVGKLCGEFQRDVSAKIIQILQASALEKASISY